MEQKINISELLKDCPSGMELDCLMYEDVHFDYIDEFNIIHCYIQHKTHKASLTFNRYGTHHSDIKAKCVIFPKGKTTWEGFVSPCKFKDGDVCYVKTKNLHEFIFIFKVSEEVSEDYIYVQKYVNLSVSGLYTDICAVCTTDDIKEMRFATEEEKQKLFDAIKAKGYKWNHETKTLEKLPKFKVGDRIKKKGIDDAYAVEIATITQSRYTFTNKNWQSVKSVDRDYELVTDIKPKFKDGDTIQDKDGYKVKITEVNVEDECYGYESMIAKGIGGIPFKEQNNWELVPNIIPKFKVGDIISNGKTTIKIDYIDDEYYYEIGGNIANRLYIKNQDEWELVKDNIKPKFKVGDRIVKKNGVCVPLVITGVSDDYYSSNTGKYVEILPVADQDDWVLVLNKFDITTLKPFDKVLYRMHCNDTWLAGFYNVCIKNKIFVIGLGATPCCIPYESNEHLLGTTDDCDDFYKTW